MTAALAVTETVVDFPLAEILDPSIPNYRTNFRGIEELEASVRESGIRVPLVVRPVAAAGLEGLQYELAIGARRREAARRAGLETVPVIIRALSDEEVHTERAIENLQRVDPDPVDEAEGFAAMLKLGWSEGQIAAKLGKPPRYVLERLQLCNLCPEGREALEKGEVLVGVAIEVAKLHTSLQKDALEDVGGDKAWRGGLSTVESARDSIQKRILLELGNAPFKLDDATLVPAAGPCTTCKKRTGNQAELFADFAADLCTDRTCHKGKLDALWQLRTKQAKAEGVEVLSKKAAAEALRSTSPQYGTGPFVRLDEKPFNSKKSVRALFGKDLPVITLARDEESGAPVELVPRKAVEALLKTAAPKDSQPKPATDAKAKAAREAERIQAEVRRRTLVALVESAEAHGILGSLGVLVMGAAHSLPDVAKTVANRRGCPLVVEEGAPTDKRGKGKRQQQLTAEQRIERLIPGLAMAELSGLLLEMLITRGAPGKFSEAHESYVEACATLGVDIASIETAVKAEQKTKINAKAVKAKQPSAPKAARSSTQPSTTRANTRA